MFLGLKNNKIDNKKIIDIHTHILPGVDDGPNDFDESLEMLRISERNGVTDIICTPHFKEHQYATSKSKIIEVFNTLDIKKTIYGINVNIYIGNEIYFTNAVPEKIEDFFSLNESGYLLVEFDPTASYKKILNDLTNLKRIGFNVVLAHVERYEEITKDIKKVKELKEMNVYIQVNSNSIVDKHNKRIYKFANKMLKKRYVDFVASDAHDTSVRTPSIKRAVDFLYKKYDRQYVDEIVYGNALKYLGI